ncbi:hypothetical protein ACFQ02_08955 [Seminibacterium arietis]|uniref:Secreted protein n=1 Tax=Seminibacterium arietis TaxID=1173502 RepID=A0ABW3IAU4_9PAST
MKRITMKTIILSLCALGVVTTAYATMGFLKGEQISGLNKICYYNVLGSTKAINIPSYGICPQPYEFY